MTPSSGLQHGKAVQQHGRDIVREAGPAIAPIPWGLADGYIGSAHAPDLVFG